MSAARVPLGRLAAQTVNSAYQHVKAVDPFHAGLMEKYQGTAPDRATVVVVGEAKRGRAPWSMRSSGAPGCLRPGPR